MTLAENSAVINAALNGTASKLTSCGELEDKLIHFAYAHKPAKKTTVPRTHIAKTATDYLKLLNDEPAIMEAYAELCQFTHPAAHSVQYLVVPQQDQSAILFGEHEQRRIEDYARTRRDVFPYLLEVGFNTPLLILKVLRHFDAQMFQVPLVDRFDTSSIPAWQKVSRYLSEGKP